MNDPEIDAFYSQDVVNSQPWNLSLLFFVGALMAPEWMPLMSQCETFVLAQEHAAKF